MEQGTVTTINPPMNRIRSIQDSSTFNLHSLPLELLELILSHLPPLDLLLLQRTSRTIHLLTSTSPTLRRKLFFLPPADYKPDTAPSSRTIDPAKVIFNPLLLPNTTTRPAPSGPAPGPAVQLPKSGPASTSAVTGATLRLTHAKLKPHWSPCPSLSQPSAFLGSEQIPNYHSANLFLTSPSTSTQAAEQACSIQPSWRRMYLTSPPLPISITLRSGGCRGSSAEVRDARKVKGDVVRDGWSGVLGPALAGLVAELAEAN
ncbi:hypothetical protein K431DRAFT_286463 [Polychaeton citri CBS 116435]|uniref:F-box domain-containing protein n=1 Tax=Polychaeton citri CBS 116435 TaxID=1314669 RepID=A0A9P4Q7Y0_9PEZI|nr:hypothetical protein K431DRAFT_286463 [Polychaeton citri CBS 116435]